MLIQPLDIFVYAWLAVALICAAYVAWDQCAGNPETAVMKWGFVSITLYMGPKGLLLYVMADKEPKPGSHEEFVKSLWKQGVGSAVHCVAGDAFYPVATIRIPRQVFDTPDQNKFCENHSFSPWHALPEHRPLGATNRLRKVIYGQISRVRLEMNSAVRQEPQ